jgi:valyl-tRNA synthetase
MNGVGASDSIAAPAAELPVNRWIIGEVVETLAKLDRAFDELRYDEMADAIYHFVWGTFCDWYVELIKGAFDEETKRVAAWAFDQILVMLHPLMPFITEELWHAMGERPYELIVAKWPEPQAESNAIVGVVHGEAVDAKAEFDWIINTIIAVRAAKNEVGIAPGRRLIAYLEDVGSSIWQRLPYAQPMFQRVGRIEIRSDKVPAGSALRISAPAATLVVPLQGVIDVAAEQDRLSKAAAAAEKERDSLAQRLSNPNFTERAKPEAVEKATADHEAKAAEAERLRAALERLG